MWEVKHARFYRKQGSDKLPGPVHYLIVARNVLNPKEVKYFVSNMTPGSNGITLEKLLWIAFSRAPVERCFEISKSELGMDHFEVRGWTAIHRHFYITQLSFLFCARFHQKLREKKDKKFLFDSRAGSPGSLYVGPDTTTVTKRSKSTLSSYRQKDCVSSEAQPLCSNSSYERNPFHTSTVKNKHKTIEVMFTK